MTTSSLGSLAILALAMVAGGGAHAAPPRYTVTPLNTFSSISVIGADYINDAGQIVGRFVPTVPLFYAPGGSFTRVKEFTGMTGMTTVHGLSDAGHLIGRNESSAFIYTPGQGVTYLSEHSLAGINERGEFVGERQGSPFRFTPGQGYTAVPGLPVQINNAGDVLFRSWSDTSDAGIQRSDGTIVRIGTLGGGDVHVSDINDRGDVVGSARTIDGLSHAFMFSADGTTIDLDTFGRSDPLAHSSARAVNNHGVVVGSWGDGTSFNGFIADRSGMFDIESLLDPEDASQWDVSALMDINDAGQLVGAGRFNGLLSAFVMNPIAAPVPEPAGALLLAAGMGIVGWGARSRQAMCRAGPA